MVLHGQTITYISQPSGCVLGSYAATMRPYVFQDTYMYVKLLINNADLFRHLTEGCCGAIPQHTEANHACKHPII